jgi:hypothetical protein
MDEQVTFADRLPVALHPQSRRFLGLWQGWRRDRRLPERGDIDWSALGSLRDSAMLVEARGRDMIQILYAGARIGQVCGFDPTGYNYLDFTAAANRSWRAHLTLAQLAQPCGYVMYMFPRFGDGRILPLEWIGAPLSRDGRDEPGLILSCAVAMANVDAAGPADPDSYMIGEGMQFLDLGYGVPKMQPAAIQDGAPLQ